MSPRQLPPSKIPIKKTPWMPLHMASSHWTMPWQWWAIKRRGLSVAGCHGWYFHRFVAVRGWFQGNWCQGWGRGLSCPVIHVQRILSWWDSVREQCHLQTSWALGNWGNMGVKELECPLIVELLDLLVPHVQRYLINSMSVLCLRNDDSSTFPYVFLTIVAECVGWC